MYEEIKKLIEDSATNNPMIDLRGIEQEPGKVEGEVRDYLRREYFHSPNFTVIFVKPYEYDGGFQKFIVEQICGTDKRYAMITFVPFEMPKGAFEGMRLMGGAEVSKTIAVREIIKAQNKRTRRN